MKNRGLKKVALLEVGFDPLNLTEAVVRIDQMIVAGGTYQVGTMNPEYLVKSQDSKQLAKAIAKMALIVPDGIGIIWAAKIKNLGRLNRVRGVDLVEALAKLGAEKGYKLALVGGQAGVAQTALTALKKKFPQLQGVVRRGPILSEAITLASVQGTVKWIKKKRPQLLLTAFSFKGPVWIEQLLRELRQQKISLVGLEVGGAFNYLAGKSRRPPPIIAGAGLEWFWRLFWEPWRLRRQLSLVKFFYLVLK